MLYGTELVKKLEEEIETTKKTMANRVDRINSGMTDEDDCFISIRCDERALHLCQDKINLIKDGGTSWFTEYATLDGKLIDAKWCNTCYGSKLRAVMPDGQVIWTNAITQKGLVKRGIKMVHCRRPAWFKFSSGGSGMYGVYTGQYVLFPSSVNYATGEDASVAPLEMKEVE